MTGSAGFPAPGRRPPSQAGVFRDLGVTTTARNRHFHAESAFFSRFINKKPPICRKFVNF
jgi:hypothetical protein